MHKQDAKSFCLCIRTQSGVSYRFVKQSHLGQDTEQKPLFHTALSNFKQDTA